MERRPEPELMDLLLEAEAYANADFANVNEAFVDRLLLLAGNEAFQRVVDPGTGPADIPIRLVKRRPAWQVVGVDGSEAMLSIARTRIAAHGQTGRIELILADALNTPMSSSSFDVVMSNSILHHVRDAALLWREIERLCRSGGFVFLRDLRRPESEADALRLVEEHAGRESELLKEEFFRSLLSAYTPEEVVQQIRDAGLALRVEAVSDRHLDAWGRIE